MKTNYESMPTELKKQAKFCLWKYEARNDKKTKVPYGVSGYRISSSNESAFTDFETVLSVSENYDGIGIGTFGNLVGIDIDDCYENGTVSELAKNIISEMQSYTEVSPSGKGIRIFCEYGSLPDYDKDKYYINNRKIHVEVYVSGYTNHFLTVTGNALNDSGFGKRDKELMAILNKYMKKEIAEKRNISQCPGSFLSDESVIYKARHSKNGAKFNALFSGDTSDYSSRSEADLAFCSYLAFYCGGDTEQMDRLMRQSNLYREKWDRDDYRAETLRKAVTGCHEFYKPIKTSSASEDFNAFAEMLDSLNITKELRYSGNDIGFGRLFADVVKDIARYSEERKKWFVYDGSRWVADTAGLRVAELAKNVSDALLVYASGCHDENDRIKLIEWSKKWVQRRFRDIYIREAQSVYPISVNSFDTNPFLFNCKNCTVDIRSGESHPHRADDFITKISPVSYDPSAFSPRWISFIEEIMSGDTEKAKFLQKSLGYGLTGNTQYECMFIYYGEKTRNGKGTLVESVLSVMGEYGITVRPETIAQKNRVDSHAPSEDIARLTGVRFANISEPSRGMLLNAAQVKSMTGNDTLNARFLNENSFDFKPRFKLYVNTNYLPTITDMTLFSSGRIIIIPFDKHFDEAEQDKGLKREFSKTSSQSAILNWLINGYHMLSEEGFTQPAAVKNATGAYSHDSDKTRQFIEDCLTEEPSAEVRTSAVYDRYRNWCYENGSYTENCRNFMQELKKIGNVVRKRPQSGGEKTTVLLGYSISETADFLK